MEEGLVVEHGGVGGLLLDHGDLVLQALQALEEHAVVGGDVELDVGGRLVVQALLGPLQLVALQLRHEQHRHPHREELGDKRAWRRGLGANARAGGLPWRARASCTAGGPR